jgi:hypothetical protein
MRKTSQDMNENFTKEAEIIKKNQSEILKLKTSIDEIKKYSKRCQNTLQEAE